MDPHTLETYRQQLLALQQQLAQRIFGLEDTMWAMDADRDIERTDRVQEEAAEVALTALDEQGRRELAAIQAALARIDAGTYGILRHCGETISAARPDGHAMARRCVACQETPRTPQPTCLEACGAHPAIRASPAAYVAGKGHPWGTSMCGMPR